MDNDEFKKDLAIDPNQLDVEAGMQGELFFKWSEAYVDARHEFDMAKLQLEVLEAEMGSKIRLDPKAHGLTKSTEAAIKEAIIASPDYEDAYLKFIRARTNYSLLEKAVNALEQKKRMIECLVTLHGQQYFAGPAVPRDLAAAWQDMVRTRERGVNEKMRSKVRRKPRKRRKKEEDDD